MLLLHIRRIAFFTVLGLLAATAWILFSKKVYEAHLDIQVGTSDRQPDPMMPPEVANIVARADSQQPATEVDILRNESVFAEAIQNVAQAQRSAPDPAYDPNLVQNYKTYYKMYAVTGGPTQPDQNPMTITSLADIAVRAYDPQTAIDLANEIGRVYQQKRQDNLKTANIQAENNLQAQLGFYERRLKTLDAEYQRAKEAARMPDVQLSTREIEDLVAQLQLKRDTVEADLHGAQDELARLRQEFKSVTPVIPGQNTKMRNPEIPVIEEKLSLARTDLAAKSRIYKPNAPEVQQIQDEVDILTQELSQAKAKTMNEQETTVQPNMVSQNIQGNIITDAARVDSLRAQFEDVQQQLATQQARAKGIPAAERAINKISRDRDMTEMKYKTVVAALNTIENRVNMAASPDVVISSPQMLFVKEPVEPNIPRTILIGLLAGISLGAIYSAARESVKPLVFSATQLEQATGLPVVATMPRLPGGEVQRVKTLLNSSRFPRKNFHDMASVVLAERETLPKTVVVCGVDGEAGSSLAALSYAAALARAGLRVTLVDANPAKIITRSLGMESDNGIVDYLTQAALISQKALAQFSMLTKPNDRLGCRVCSYGVADVTTLTDFSDDRIAGIIEALKPDADVLIIETAPSGRQPDAVRLARHADEVLATFESGTSSDRSVDTLRDLFADAGVKKMSMVLTSTLERVA